MPILAWEKTISGLDFLRNPMAPDRESAIAADIPASLRQGKSAVTACAWATKSIVFSGMKALVAPSQTLFNPPEAFSGPGREKIRFPRRDQVP
jgi:hypothetical protein